MFLKILGVIFLCLIVLAIFHTIWEFIASLLATKKEVQDLQYKVDNFRSEAWREFKLKSVADIDEEFNRQRLSAYQQRLWNLEMWKNEQDAKKKKKADR